MGQKLNFPESEDLFNDEIDVGGITGACYCCGAQIAMSFNLMQSLPYVQIEEEIFYVFLCESCEADVGSLNWAEIEDVSYDLLWLVQEELDEEILKFNNDNKRPCSSDERTQILIKVYKGAEDRIKEEISENYLKQLTTKRNNGGSS